MDLQLVSKWKWAEHTLYHPLRAGSQPVEPPGAPGNSGWRGPIDDGSPKPREESHSVCLEGFRVSGLETPGCLPSSLLRTAVLLSLFYPYSTEGNWAMRSSSFILLFYFVFIGHEDTVKRPPCLT